MYFATCIFWIVCYEYYFSEFQNVTVTTNAEIYQVCLRLILRISTENNLGNVNYKLFIDAVSSAMSLFMLHEYV